MRNRDEEITYLINHGKLWRAKEILQGRIQQMGYDTDQYERYGQILLAMNDNIQAGKYLFLSGIRKTEYEECIRLYINRYTTKNKTTIIDTFPKAVRIADDDSYPPQLLEDLKFLDLTPDLIRQIKPVFTSYSRTMTKLETFFFFAIAFILIAAFLIGVYNGLLSFIGWLF
ncbi:MAG: hypothetical protein COA73_18575 [Candidatus Hydrogenedentota bacterium]|nr:MAG: hypothetical protein COA73_18575 [Candidatus Hydrogenedentota bacterium]